MQLTDEALKANAKVSLSEEDLTSNAKDIITDACDKYGVVKAEVGYNLQSLLRT